MIKNIIIVIGAVFIVETYCTNGIIEKSFIQKFLPENPIVVECGAHIGSDTLEMASLWPTADIHAFEAVPYIFDVLKKRTGDLNNIFCYTFALSDNTGSTKFYISSGGGNASSSLLKPQEHLNDHPAITFNNVIDVATITLDDWAELYYIDHVDFLWLDMQGAEYMTLVASPRILSTVRVIYTEVSLHQSYEGTPLYPEFRSWLESQGFEVVKEELPWTDMGNVLFVRKN